MQILRRYSVHTDPPISNLAMAQNILITTGDRVALHPVHYSPPHSEPKKEKITHQLMGWHGTDDASCLLPRGSRLVT